jgi:hypothetical protein
MTDSSSPPATAQSTGTQREEGPSGAQETAREVAGQAQEKAQETAQRAQGMLREQIDERSTKAGEQISSTAGDLKSVGEELRKQGKETPAKLADNAAERTEKLGSYLADADSDRILSDLEDFGRRQPWVVLAGGLALGLVGARFLKASSSSRYRSQAELSERMRERPATLQPPSPPQESAPAIEPTTPVTSGAAP